MSRSKYGVELCTILVDETFGELSARIFTILLVRGRLSIPQLAKHSFLTVGQLRHGLALLIQQGLVYYQSSSDIGNRSAAGICTTEYEANAEAAYALIRSGKIVEAAENRYGTWARAIVQDLLALGHTKVSDIIAARSHSSDCHLPGSSCLYRCQQDTTSQKSGCVASVTELNAMICFLLEFGLVEPVTELMFQSPTDLYSRVEKEILWQTYGGSIKGTKQKEELVFKVRDRIQEMKTASRVWMPMGLKKGLNWTSGQELNGTGKRTRPSEIGNSSLSAQLSKYEGIMLDHGLFLRVNFEKFAVILRNRRLADLVSTRIGESTSRVYAEFLMTLELKIPSCRPDSIMGNTGRSLESLSLSTMEFTTLLDKSVNISMGIGKAPGDQIDTSFLNHIDDGEGDLKIIRDAGDDGASDNANPKMQKRARVMFQEKAPKPASVGDPQNRMIQIKDHLMLLAEDNCRFLRRSGNNGLGEWSIDFERLVQSLRDSELDSIIFENFGRSGHRLARILREMGRLDEKQLPNLALMKQKDVRTKLAEMQMAGMVDIQEVPRDNNRATSRTIFLWYFDADRVSSIILENVYKSMTRCLERLELEKRRAIAIISLSERPDVRLGKEEDYLTGQQLNELRKVRRKENMILGQIGRLDVLVAIFRDF